MAGLVLLADVAVGALALYFAKRFLTRKSKSGPLPPGPKGLPLVGNVADLPPPGTQEWLHWKKHQELYGQISSITVLGQVIVILHDYETSVNLLEKKSAIFSDRPTLPFGGEMVGWENSLPMSHYGERFRAYRRAMHQFMGTRAAVAEFAPMEELETRRFLLRTMKKPDSLQDQIRTTAGAIILKLSHGYTTETEGPDTLVSLADDVLAEFALSAQPGLWIVDIAPFLRHLPDWVPGTSFKRIAARWRLNVEEFIEKPFQFVKQQKAQGIAPPSYVGTLLDKAKSTYDEFVIKWSAAGVYGGGADTTVSAIYTFYLAMVLHPEAQRKAQEEIDRVIGTDRLPTLADRDNLPYIEAIMKESLRWNPVAPMGLPHATIEDTTYKGNFIPKGAIVMANLWGMGHDPSTHADPMEFKPERFLSTDGHEPEADPRNYCFGFGRRVCPGKELADASVWISIAMSLAAFNIAKAKDAQGREIEPEINYNPGIISHPKVFKASITPRSEKAAALVHSVEEEHPQERSDAETLASIKWERSNVFPEDQNIDL